MTRPTDKRESRRIEDDEPENRRGAPGYVVPRGSTSDPRLRAALKSDDDRARANTEEADEKEE